MKRNLFVAVLIIELALSGFAQTQEPKEQLSPTLPKTQTPKQPEDIDVVKISTNLVQVDPVITDKNGKVVTDLREDEVEILEDGKVQKIINFSFVPLELRSPDPTANAKSPVDKNAPPVPPVRLKSTEVRRTIAIVVDDLGLSHDSIFFVRKALKKFLEEQMEAGDLVAILRTGAGIGALQQFTSDKRQLYAAVDKVKFNASGQRIGLFSPGANDLLAAPGTSEFGEDIDQLREDVFTIGTLGAVNYVVRGLRNLPGRKSVVLFSGGIAGFGFSEQNFRVQMAMERLVDLANRASVVIHTIDARGLETLNFTAADGFTGGPQQTGQFLSALRRKSFNSQGGLKGLSEATGGVATVNSNDLPGGIRRALDDQRGYYLLGYRPDDSTFEPIRGRRRFHRISVRVKRAGQFNVRVRNGFFGVPEEEGVPAPKTPRDLMLAALTSPFGSADVNLRLTSLFHNEANIGSTMRSLLHINAADLTFTEQPDGWRQAVIDLVAMTFGDNGSIVDTLSHTHTLKLRGEAYEDALKRGITYSINVPIKKAGAYQLRTALRDTVSNRIGSASQFIEVPDINKKRLTLSGIVLHGVNLSSVQKSQTSKTAEEPDPDPLSSAATRQFTSGELLEYGLTIYNAQLDKAAGKPQLLTQTRLFRNGQLVFAGKEIALDAGSQTDMKRLENSGAIQLASQMEPGDYVLQILVTDLLRKDKYRTSNQWIDFEIVK